ncbi:NUC185 domain-containing protein [Lipomyces tetrasporus]|uniref:NUC185 domain-containing protein n=1 Tax=Lipomyces tetrasporus TaxID=54092 RepID=A0AAD7QVX1_9ASCO|nr:NUC185 domain-containing protein [Lipomyces tetrasporus]KAJ8102318.1 NUC185 domain-containing protein [Lipomyces tetrasporus]
MKSSDIIASPSGFREWACSNSGDLLDDEISQCNAPTVDGSRTRTKPTQEELVKELEECFFTPSLTSFSDFWVNLLQESPSFPHQSLYTDLYGVPNSITRSTTRFVRSGLEGAIIGYEDYTSPAPLSGENSKNSSSFARQPAPKSDFVRGRAGFVPFAPGGLDGIASASSSLEGIGIGGIVKRDENGLLNTAPGLPRGMNVTDDGRQKDNLEDLEESYENEISKVEDIQPVLIVTHPTTGTVVVKEKIDSDLIDDLLPTESIKSLFESPFGKPGDSRLRGKEWAHVVDVNTDIVNFHELVPKMAKEWHFELDTFQKEAVYHLEQGDSVFVAAHTSAGKTVVAEYAIAMANRNMTKAIYTSPIKALSNQKFRDFRQIFDDVGILTGDVQINPHASCVIMTTEILRSMLYKGADLIRDVEFVIFDEVHYVNDLERGVVWEEVIIMLPDHVKLILLSATVPNTYEFASWVGRTKKKDIYVISTPKRPVPLEHFLWANNQMFKIVDSQKKFLMQGWSDAERAVNPVKEFTATQGQRGGRGGASGGRGRGQQMTRGGGRGGSASGRGSGRGSSYLNNKGGFRTNNSFDRNIWIRIVQTLHKAKLQPVVIFVFSKRRCEEYANSLQGLDYCTSSEKSQIHIFIESAVSRLKKEDQVLPQILRIRELLARGIAVHHGGLLPIVKEVVEILFAKSLVKVLFATETFAMGLNLPTRTVVFAGIRKHDGRSFRDLLAGEYTQMAGRAGRRGLDTTGTVIIAFAGDQPPEVSILNKMTLGPPTKLQSQFRLTYNMILNLLRVEALKVEEMIKRSFSENATQSLIPEHENTVKASEASLRNFKREQCSICDTDLETCHAALVEAKELMTTMIERACETSFGTRMLTAKRLAVVQTEESSRTVCLIVGANVQRRTFHCYGMFPSGGIVERKQKEASDMVPFLPEVRSVLGALKLDGVLVERNIPFSAVEFFCKSSVDIDTYGLQRKERRDIVALRNFLLTCEDRIWEEVEWIKMKNYQFVELSKRRNELRLKIAKCQSLRCPQFIKHFTQLHEESLLKKNIAELKQVISDQNLELLPDYEQRIEVLKDLGFIDENLNVELKGRVACEINSGHELIMTELILENFLADYEPEEIVALLSCFIFQEKTQVEIGMVTPRLDEGRSKIVQIAARVNEVQSQHQISIPDESAFDPETVEQRFGLMEVVYEWARGMPFNRITDLTDVLEGTIVRVITRLDEVCREVKSAARIIGDPTLHAKMELSQEKIKRDIVFCTSLYL